jgi:hypothetical protein
MIDTLLTEFKEASQQYDLKFKTYKKLVTVMIESLENIYKYSDEYISFLETVKEYFPTFSINKNSHTIQVVTSNPIRNQHVDILRSHIECVNGKSRDELKQLYFETITNGKFSKKGGAGLGFIEMAKTSGNNLEYSFDPISDEFSLYTFKVTFTL